MENIVVGRYEGHIPDELVASNTEERNFTGPDHGYLGWIEPEDKSWIVFVRNDHVPEVYFDRDPETGAVL